MRTSGSLRYKVRRFSSPHLTGGYDSPDPHTRSLADKALWENRHADPEAIEAELRGPKGRGWLMRWLPTRAHDNGLFLVYSNGVGVDENEIRTGNAMILDPYEQILAETWKAGDDMVVADLNASLLKVSTGRRWIVNRRPDLYEPLTAWKIAVGARSSRPRAVFVLDYEPGIVSTVPTGLEQDTRTVRFDKKGV